MSTLFNSLFWLFLVDIFHQVLFYFGGVVAVGILLWEKRTNKPLTWKWVAAFFLFCLFVSCFQAFVDEHHNSDQLVKDKEALYGEKEFWRSQSYQKDGNLRSVNETLAKNLAALTNTQQTENDTQKSLTSLSSKILDLSKPDVLKITTRAMQINRPPGMPAGASETVILVAETNRRIPSFNAKIKCSTSFLLVQATIDKGIISQSPSARQVEGQTELDLDFNNTAWDTQQPLIAVITGQNLKIGGCSINQQ